ncbi:unnamed protein product [Prunus brigantina]
MKWDRDCVGCTNLTAWCSGPRGCALTRDVLLWMRCGCARASQHGLPCVEMVMSGGVGGGF